MYIIPHDRLDQRDNREKIQRHDFGEKNIYKRASNLWQMVGKMEILDDPGGRAACALISH
jgi:hypothetical protein